MARLVPRVRAARPGSVRLPALWPPPTYGTRPYGDTASWNIPVAGLALHASSSTLAARLWTAGGNPDGYWTLDPDTATWAVRLYPEATDNYTLSITTPTPNNLASGSTFRWSPAWDQQPGAARLTVVLDPPTGREWNLTGLQVNHATKTLTAATAFLVPGSYLTGRAGFAPARSVGIPALAMLVRPWEIAQGRIAHALSLTAPDLDDDTAVAPATKIAPPAGLTVAAGIPLGTRYHLNVTDAEIETWAASLPAETGYQGRRSIKVIVKAMAEFGFFVTEGSAGVTLQLEDRASAADGWTALGLDSRTVGGRPWPREALLLGSPALLTQARARAFVTSDAYTEDLPPDQPEPPPPPPPPPSGLTEVLITQAPVVSYNLSTPLPALNTTWTDPAFGSQMTRITQPGVGFCHPSYDYCGHRYQSSAAWNRDGTILVIDKGVSGAAFLNGSTYAFLRQLGAAGEVEWDPTDASRMIGLGGDVAAENQIFYWYPMQGTEGTTTVIATISGYTNFSYGSKGNPSKDGRWVAVMATRTSDAKSVVFAYDIVNKVKHADIVITNYTNFASYATITPSGRYISIFADSSGGNQWWHFDRTNNNTLTQHWTETHRPGHGDFYVDASGVDWSVGRSKASGIDSSHVIKRRVSDGFVVDLTPGTQTLYQHVSCRNLTGYTEYCVATAGGLQVNTGAGGYAAPYQEVDFIRLDGSGKIVRVVQTRSVDGSADNAYYAESHGCPSFDGKRVVFRTNWGVDGNPVVCFVATVPGAT